MTDMKSWKHVAPWFSIANWAGIKPLLGWSVRWFFLGDESTPIMTIFGGFWGTILLPYYYHIWYHIITIYIYIYYIHKPAVIWGSVWALGFWQKGPYTNLRDDGGLWTRLYFGLWLTPGRESYLIWFVVWDIWIIFPYIGNVIIPTEFHIFQMGSNHQPVHQHLSSQKKRFTGVNLHTHRNQHG